MYTKNQKTEESKWENLFQLEEALLQNPLLNLPLNAHSSYRVQLQANRKLSLMRKSWEAIQLQMIYSQGHTSTGHTPYRKPHLTQDLCTSKLGIVKASLQALIPEWWNTFWVKHLQVLESSGLPTPWMAESGTSEELSKTPNINLALVS